jgi:hypothetical protein
MGFIGFGRVRAGINGDVNNIFRIDVSRWTTRAEAPGVAAAIGGAVVGYVVQSTFTDGDIDPTRYCKGFSALN